MYVKRATSSDVAQLTEAAPELAVAAVEVAKRSEPAKRRKAFAEGPASQLQGLQCEAARMQQAEIVVVAVVAVSGQIERSQGRQRCQPLKTCVADNATGAAERSESVQAAELRDSRSFRALQKPRSSWRRPKHEPSTAVSL